MKIDYPPTPPMPDVARLLIPLEDLRNAANRGLNGAWNMSQLKDCLNSIHYWLDKIEKDL